MMATRYSVKRRLTDMKHVMCLLALAAFLQLLVSFLYIVTPDRLGLLLDPLPTNKPRAEAQQGVDMLKPLWELEHAPTPSKRPRMSNREWFQQHMENNKQNGSNGALPVIQLPGDQKPMANQRPIEEIIPRKWPIPEGPGTVPKEWLALKDSNGQCSQCPFKERRGVFCLQEDVKPYTGRSGNTTCLLEGTHWNTTILRNNQKCVCNIGWRGQACSVPDSVARSDLSATQKSKLTLRDKPRRLINAFPFHMEFELLEARIAEYGDLVDVFLILESNFTAYGESKSLELLAKLQSGAFAEVACKIVYVFLDYFPHKAYYDGHLADRLHRDHIGVQGVGQQLRDFRNDDIFLLNDADEIPARETILFLKLHNGYPEPFGYYYRWNVYGFYWTTGLPSHVDTGLTMRMLTEAVGLDNTSQVKFISSMLNDRNLMADKYVKNVTRNMVRHWDFGNFVHHAGWHCSWCFPPEGIRDKLKSAQNGDFPRWGDRPEKLQLDYIESLLRTGKWFDNEDRFKAVETMDSRYAPPHFLRNPQRYEFLLNNIYKHHN